jgi:hypothetical protein
MIQRCGRALLVLVIVVAVLVIPAFAQKSTVKGTFVLGGVDARLTNVRAVRTVLDDGKTKTPGYAVLLSAKPAVGDIHPWRSGEASERGSFIYMMLEPSGAVWIADGDETFGDDRYTADLTFEANLEGK